jgi:hypothetical protein
VAGGVTDQQMKIGDKQVQIEPMTKLSGSSQELSKTARRHGESTVKLFTVCWCSWAKC